LTLFASRLRRQNTQQGYRSTILVGSVLIVSDRLECTIPGAESWPVGKGARIGPIP